jgi:hypothetical protein
MIAKDRLMIQAALNRNHVLRSTFANSATVLSSGDVSIEIDEYSKTIIFKIGEIMIVLSPEKRHLYGLNYLNGFNISNLAALSNCIKIEDNGLHMYDGEVWKRITGLASRKPSRVLHDDEIIDDEVQLMTVQYYHYDIQRIENALNSKADIDHTHSELPIIDHNHDDKYANIEHNHDDKYAAIDHKHDDKYTAIDHNHDNQYPKIEHNHDTKYAIIEHNHDDSYVNKILYQEHYENYFKFVKLTNEIIQDFTKIFGVIQEVLTFSNDGVKLNEGKY